MCFYSLDIALIVMLIYYNDNCVLIISEKGTSKTVAIKMET